MMRSRRKERRRNRPIRLILVTDQAYSFEDETRTQWHWSIAVARHLAEADGILEMISLSELEITLAFVRAQYPGLDEEYALTTDLDKPLLFVPFRDKVRLIDGWHRIMHAVVLGRDLLPAYFLSQA